MDIPASWSSASLGLAAAVALAEKRDTHALTHAIVEQLEALPFVGAAFAYEIFGDTTKATGEASDISELVVHRFPLYMQTGDKQERTELIRQFAQTEGLNLITTDAAKGDQLAILSVSDTAGPRRVVVAECGVIDGEQQEVLRQLQALYINLVFTLDSKERDLLTELLNRQTFDQHLMLVSQALRKTRAVADTASRSWLAMLDIDHFKLVNDSYGHLYGDEILVLFAGLMKQWFRYTDFLFRYGGEEFVVILNQTDRAGAEYALGRFREAVADYKFPTVGRITVSGGFCEIDPAKLPSSLVDRADKALYHAKRNGRNQISQYESVYGHTHAEPDTKIDLF